MTASISASLGFVPMAVPGQINIFAKNKKTKELESKLREIIRDVFNDYYKPTPELSSYYGRHSQDTTVYVYREPSYLTHFSSTRVVNNYYGAAPTSRDKKEDNSLVLFAIVGGIIAVVGGYLLGKEVKKHTLANDGLAAVKELKAEAKKDHIDAQIDAQTKELLQTGKRFFKKMEKDAYTWIVIKTAVVAGGVLMAIGGFAAMPAVLAAGGITAAVGLTAAAIRWGFTLGDDAKMSQLAQKVLNA